MEVTIYRFQDWDLTPHLSLLLSEPRFLWGTFPGPLGLSVEPGPVLSALVPGPPVAPALAHWAMYWPRQGSG